MAYSEPLANRVREALADLPEVGEKRMFGGICFMVNGKMCVCVGKDELMCRIGPEDYKAAVAKDGCRPMIRKGRVMKGPVFVDENKIQAQSDFEYWMSLSLDFNKSRQ